MQNKVPVTQAEKNQRTTSDRILLTSNRKTKRKA